LKALDPYTLQIKLTKKSSVFLHALTMSYASAVAHEVVEYYKADFGNHPVGTGPFQLQNFSMNQLIWVKNPTYHTQFYPNEGTAEDQKAGRLADAGKSIPFLDKIVDDIIIEDQPAWLNFIRGDHDYLLKIPKDNQASIFDANQKPVKEIQDRGITLFTEPGIWFNYIAMNMEDPVLGGEENKFLRKAMSMAFDEAPAIEKFYLGLAQRAESMIPPGIFGYDPQYKNPSREYNLVKAKEILAKAGHANGEGIPELVFDLKSDLAQRQLAVYFQRSMAELGIRVKLNVVSWPELLSRLRKKQAQIWLMSWLYDYPDVENGLQLLYSKNESPGSNEANYKNPKYDALYEKFIVSESESEKKVLIAKMRDFLAEDVPWILTLHQTETRLTNPWTKNFKIHAFEHNVEKYLRIDQDERKKMLSR
jgi:ABC-type transport system substrate-binding protein